MGFAKFFVGLVFLWIGSVLPAQSADSARLVYGKVEVRSKNNQPLGVNSGVVVYLKEVNGNKGFTPMGGRPSMASENMKFSPDVLPVLVGTSVVFPNKDDAIHNVYSASETKKFDFGRYGNGEENSIRFDKPGIVDIFCKIHPLMAGTILVLENPFFTTTDEKGNYSISGIPPGKYTMVSWFPFGNSQEQPVDLTQEAKVRADFVLVKVRASNHKKKAGEKKPPQR